MKAFIIVLRLAAPIFFIVGALHLLFGSETELMLGANLSFASLSDPVLDSQNRFYGVAFTLYGALLILASFDIERYRPMLYCLFAVFFAAGLARVASIAVVGWPSMPVTGLMITELVLPLVLTFWLSRIRPVD